jgi:hypothetical protein
LEIYLKQGDKILLECGGKYDNLADLIEFKYGKLQLRGMKDLLIDGSLNHSLSGAL